MDQNDPIPALLMYLHMGQFQVECEKMWRILPTGETGSWKFPRALVPGAWEREKVGQLVLVHMQGNHGGML